MSCFTERITIMIKCQNKLRWVRRVSNVGFTDEKFVAAAVIGMKTLHIIIMPNNFLRNDLLF